eukprot:5214328-Pleurochrysis_carterae.AAC.2
MPLATSSAQCTIRCAIGKTTWEECSKGILKEVTVVQYVSWIAVMFFTRYMKRERRMKRAERKEIGNREVTKGEKRTRQLLIRRRQIQERIKDWSKVQNLKYEGNIEIKLEHLNTVRCSKGFRRRRWRRIYGSGVGAKRGNRGRTRGEKEARGRARRQDRWRPAPTKMNS